MPKLGIHPSHEPSIGGGDAPKRRPAQQEPQIRSVRIGVVVEMDEATDTRSGFIPTIGIAAAIGVAAATVVTVVITAAAAAVATAATVIGTFIGTAATRSFFSAFCATISIAVGLISTRLTSAPSSASRQSEPP